jgi:hypothetical protein
MTSLVISSCLKMCPRNRVVIWSIKSKPQMFFRYSRLPISTKYDAHINVKVGRASSVAMMGWCFL